MSFFKQIGFCFFKQFFLHKMYDFFEIENQQPYSKPLPPGASDNSRSFFSHRGKNHPA